MGHAPGLEPRSSGTIKIRLGSASAGTGQHSTPTFVGGFDALFTETKHSPDAPYTFDFLVNFVRSTMGKILAERRGHYRRVRYLGAGFISDSGLRLDLNHKSSVVVGHAVAPFDFATISAAPSVAQRTMTHSLELLFEWRRGNGIP